MMSTQNSPTASVSTADVEKLDNERNLESENSEPLEKAKEKQTLAGAVGAIAKFLSNSHNKYVFNTAVVLVVFDIILHAAGTYFVYKNYQPHYDPASGDEYCNRTTYLLAFWILTFQYTLLGFFILLAGCYKLMSGDFKKQ
ncbi:hypothetical protein NQ315_004735 [Exocentrus adspersus]|uniref:Uncharacterized protein n=1 Tax=Exocentrus adspersus TaxID=1586481 RepID=A0AAV8W1V0_9CUCU|nr:hypothetical protein NQ315_004735 [Exocentrus adspersus]